MITSVPLEKIQRLSIDIDIKEYRSIKNCPLCGEFISIVITSREAVCRNCGYTTSVVHHS